jgi:hypothetical protein
LPSRTQPNWYSSDGPKHWVLCCKPLPVVVSGDDSEAFGLELRYLEPGDLKEPALGLSVEDFLGSSKLREPQGLVLVSVVGSTLRLASSVVGSTLSDGGHKGA